jgi:ubiquinone/menaquinone biosynthesis C-methylase UbiE
VEADRFDFDRGAAYWEDIYASDGFDAVAYFRSRHERVMEWVGDLGLPRGARVLEVGFGAGGTILDLAGLGFHVTGIDASQSMLEQARRRVAEAGAADQVELSLGDAHALPAGDGTFDLVLSEGVLAWLADPAGALAEMARVTRPGGTVIAVANNRWQLNRLLDPRLNPLVDPLKLRVRGLARRYGYDLRLDSRHPASLSRSALERAMRAAGLEPRLASTTGFGPFTLFARDLLGTRRDLALHHHLQGYADRGVPGLRGTGAQLMVLATKP